MILRFLLIRLLCGRKAHTGSPKNLVDFWGVVSELCDRLTMSKIAIKSQKHKKMLNY